MKSLLPILSLPVSLAILVPSVSADERKFGFSYETTVMPKGEWEIEQYMTWKSSKSFDHSFQEFGFKTELEYGLTETTQLSLYLANWRTRSGRSVDDGAEYQSSAFSVIHQLTNPATSFLGSAIYGEVIYGPEVFALEGKLLLQKNIGRWMLVYNAVIEAAWEGDDYEETVGEWKNTFGATYQFNPVISAGFEVFHEVEFANWEEAGDHVVYAGPNISWSKNNFFATLAPLVQLTDVDGEAEFMTRLIFGFHF